MSNNLFKPEIKFIIDVLKILNKNKISVGTFAENLKYADMYQGKTILIKCSGGALEDTKKRAGIIQDILYLQAIGMKIVFVHGGKTIIGEYIQKAIQTNPNKKISNHKINGLRATDMSNIHIIANALDALNKMLVLEIKKAAYGTDAKPIGISGTKIFSAEQETQESLIGRQPIANHALVKDALNKGKIVIISPLGSSLKNPKVTLNNNADDAAVALCAALKPDKVLFLSDVNGVLDKKGNTIPTLSIKEIEGLIENGTITEGMRVKMEALASLIKSKHVDSISVGNGNTPHAILNELLTAKGDTGSTKIAYEKVLKTDMHILNTIQALTNEK
ncbi:MAG: acetylglutamate kinase [Lactobacillales bacterium]|jgi:acetylglutamate kinase|nr:acetylglutamate kinase [Lactobacillales bacterium]